MFDALYIGATGMVAHQNQLDVIANNIANVNTVGFRRGVVSFEDVSAQLAATALSPGGGAALQPVDAASGAGSVAQTSLSMLARCRAPGKLWTWQSTAPASSKC
jgi:flagellar hook-basal body protein